MIMKANKQIGFIYKDNESIDKILKDGEVIFERGFLREKTSTTLPITFGGVGKDLKDYRVYGNTYQNSTSGKNICLQANIIDTNTIRFDINSNEINRTFTLSLIPPLSVNSMSIVAFADGVNLRSVGTINLISGERSTTTITLTESIYNTIQNASEVHFNLYKSGAGISTTSIIEESQIENNSSFTSYEPYTGGQPSPSPEFNQKIISCGDKTKNLFLAPDTPPDTPSQLNLPTYSKINKNSFTLYYNQTTTAVKSPYVRIDFDITQFKPNTRYTISKKYTVSGDNFRNVGAIRSYINGTNGSVVNSNSFSFTTPSEISSLGVYFYLGYENRTVGESQITFYDIQVEENSSVTEFEPYGYKIPVNVRSENLFSSEYAVETQYKQNGDINTNRLYVLESNKIVMSYNNNNHGALYFNKFKLLPGTYYLKAKLSQSEEHTSNYFRYAVRNFTNNVAIIPSTADVITSNFSLSFTISEELDISFMLIPNTAATGDLYIENVMLSRTDEPYQPYYNEITNIYLNEPLRGIGEYSDYIDFINGKIVRNIKKIVLDGSEDWYTSSGTSQVAFNKGVGYIHDTTKLPCNISSNCQMPNNNLYFYNTGYSLADWKTFLSITNAIVCGRLATPTEESITLPNIPTVDGNNTLNIETEITPSQVYIKYKSNE